MIVGVTVALVPWIDETCLLRRIASLYRLEHTLPCFRTSYVRVLYVTTFSNWSNDLLSCRHSWDPISPINTLPTCNSSSPASISTPKSCLFYAVARITRHVFRFPLILLSVFDVLDRRQFGRFDSSVLSSKSFLKYERINVSKSVAMG